MEWQFLNSDGFFSLYFSILYEGKLPHYRNYLILLTRRPVHYNSCVTVNHSYIHDIKAVAINYHFRPHH